MPKFYLDKDVLTAATERVRYLFSEFSEDELCVSFSGGKDSTALFWLLYTEARRIGRRLNVLFLDWEAQYSATIDNVRTVMSLPGVVPYWVCLPVSTDNGSSYFEPVWTCWDPGKRAVWVRGMPDLPGVISDEGYFDFYRHAMSFEDFVKGFAGWWARRNGRCVSVLGVRASESLSRHFGIRAVKNKVKYKDMKWINRMKANREEVYNAMPIYDWEVCDVWKYVGENGFPYNRIYDLMYAHGRTLSDMRVCEPFGFEARGGIKYYHEIEPDMWDRMLNRVDGLNAGSLYATGSLYAHLNKVRPPDGHTWKSWSELLLDTMPEPMGSHYRRRIGVFKGWFKKHLGWDDLKEEDDPKLERTKKGGSYRMVCFAILKNDMFCESLSFSVNKNEFEKIKNMTAPLVKNKINFAHDG